jgi:hypothetical protein
MPPPAVAVHRSRALARPPRLRDRLAAWPSGGGVAERRRFGTAGAGTGSRSDLPSAAADAGRGGRCAAGRGAKGRHPSAGRPLARSDPAPWPRDQFGALGRRTAAGGAGRGKADFSVTGVSHRQPCRRARPGSVALGRNGAAQSWRSHRGAGRRRWRICETAPGRDLRGCRRDRGITVRHHGTSPRPSDDKRRRRFDFQSGGRLPPAGIRLIFRAPPPANPARIPGAVDLDSPFPSWPGDSPGHLPPHVVEGCPLLACADNRDGTPNSTVAGIRRRRTKTASGRCSFFIGMAALVRPSGTFATVRRQFPSQTRIGRTRSGHRFAHKLAQIRFIQFSGLVPGLRAPPRLKSRVLRI